MTELQLNYNLKLVELVKRISIFVGLIVLFVGCFALVNISSQYGDNKTGDLGVYFGLKKVKTVPIASRPVQGIEVPPGELQRIGKENPPSEASPTDSNPTSFSSRGDSGGVNLSSPSPTPANYNSNGGIHQAPLGTF